MVATLAIIACGGREEPRGATAVIVDRDGDKIGTARLEETADGVLMRIEAEDLAPGEHAIHIHERGVCEPPAFESAGGHFDPGNGQHGLADRDGAPAHAGDLENILVDDAGAVLTHRVIRGVTLAPDADEDSPSLLGPAGTAVVIHADRDDYTTDPAGASGERVACGVIEKG